MNDPTLPIQRRGFLAMLSAVGGRVAQRTVTPIYGSEVSGLRPWKSLFTHSAILLRAAWRKREQRARAALDEPCASVS